jgi:hypothetical protein
MAVRDPISSIGTHAVHGELERAVQLDLKYQVQGFSATMFLLSSERVLRRLVRYYVHPIDWIILMNERRGGLGLCYVRDTPLLRLFRDIELHDLAWSILNSRHM